MRYFDLKNTFLRILFTFRDKKDIVLYMTVNQSGLSI